LAGAGPLSASERRHYRLGVRCFERGDDETALEHLSELARTREGFADVHYMLGVLYERRDDVAAAARSLSQALRINPGYAEAMLALASVYERQGDFERSREVTARARASSPAADGRIDATTRGKLANLQAALGDAYREAGELREAIEAYRKALDRCPTFHDIRMRLAVALREAGLPHQALGELQRVRRANPGWLDASVQIGLLHYTLGRSDEAVREWRAVLVREPGRRDAAMYLRMLGAEHPPGAAQRGQGSAVPAHPPASGVSIRRDS
jgi:tetratricopeptide (TPR) repeat protein